MAKGKNIKLKIDCLMQWLGSLTKKPKLEIKKEPEQFVRFKEMNRR